MMRRRHVSFLAVCWIVVSILIGILYGWHASAQTANPESILVTDVSERGAVVSWISTDAETGSVMYREADTVEAFTETGDPTPGRLHYIPLTGLTPETTYEFYITADGANVFADETGTFWMFTTPAEGDIPAIPTPTAGVVMPCSDGEIDTAIVYGYIEDGDDEGSADMSSVFSFLVKPSDVGTWVLNNVRVFGTNEPFVFGPGDFLHVWVEAADDGTASTPPEGVLLDTVLSAIGAMDIFFLPLELVCEPCPAPSAPQSLVARSQTHGIQLKWNRVDEPGVNGHNIYRSTLEGPFEHISSKHPPVYVDHDVTTGQDYSYYVTATSVCGGESDPSNTVTESPGGRTR